MEKSFEDWKVEIDFQLEYLKKTNRHAYFGFSLSMTQAIANEIKSYFEKEKYSVEVRECPRKLWDVAITW